MTIKKILERECKVEVTSLKLKIVDDPAFVKTFISPFLNKVIYFNLIIIIIEENRRVIRVLYSTSASLREPSGWDARQNRSARSGKVRGTQDSGRVRETKRRH